MTKNVHFFTRENRRPNRMLLRSMIRHLKIPYEYSLLKQFFFLDCNAENFHATNQQLFFQIFLIKMTISDNILKMLIPLLQSFERKS